MRRTLAALTLTAAAVPLAACGNPHGNDRDVTFTVIDKERVCSGSDSGQKCQYLIYTDDGTYKNVDSVLNKKFRSSDLQGSLQVGHRYRVHVEGYRSGVLSEYPNVLKVLGEEPS